MHRIPQCAGTLAVDDGDGLQMAHDGSGEEGLHHALRLQRLHAPDIQLPAGGSAETGHSGPGGLGGLFLHGGPLIVLNEPYFVGLGLHFQNTGL